MNTRLLIVKIRDLINQCTDDEVTMLSELVDMASEWEMRLEEVEEELKDNQDFEGN